MMEYWIVFDRETGVERGIGVGREGSIAIQRLPQGCDILAIPSEITATGDVDYEMLRNVLMAKVNAAADAACTGHASPSDFQKLRYAEKLAEAKAWSADADPEGFPYLRNEADLTGQTVGEVAASILAAAGTVACFAQIEAKRVAANRIIRAAGENIAAMVRAANVDFSEGGNT
jgi:hypothetical protein